MKLCYFLQCEVLQKNIPKEAQNSEALLFSDFEKADAEKDRSHCRKVTLVGKLMYCSYLSHEVTPKEKILETLY